MKASMSLTKPEKILAWTVAIIVLIMINLFALYVLNDEFELSIYREDYPTKQRQYHKQLGAKVHPFYGLANGNTVGFDSEVSAERNFNRVSPVRAENPISILVLGGSVASHLSELRVAISPDFLLSDALNSRFETDRFVVYNAAFGGGKQPQQYFKLMYLDLLGFKPDVIINYDGFNEIALPLGENFYRDINAIYPRSFAQSLISSVYDGGCFKLNNWLLSFNSYVPAFELPKWLYVRHCHNEATGANTEITLNWPDQVEIEKRDYAERAKRVWQRSSDKIAQYAKANNIEYIHVLQPNQYLPGSKLLSPLEKRDFYNLELLKQPIEQHYGSLTMNSLQAPYKVDQRYLFKNESRTVYSDSCCHFNNLGMTLIIEDLIQNTQDLFKGLLKQ
jgi:hypothetical protein